MEKSIYDEPTQRATTVEEEAKEWRRERVGEGERERKKKMRLKLKMAVEIGGKRVVSETSTS